MINREGFVESSGVKIESELPSLDLWNTERERQAQDKVEVSIPTLYVFGEARRGRRSK